MSFEEYCGPDDPDDSHTIGREDNFRLCFEYGEFDALFEQMNDGSLGRFNDPTFALSQTFITSIQDRKYLPYLRGMLEQGYCFPGGYRSTLYIFVHDPEKFGLRDLKFDLYFLEIIEAIILHGGPLDHFFNELLEGENGYIRLSRCKRNFSSVQAEYLCSLAKIFESDGLEKVLEKVQTDIRCEKDDFQEISTQRKATDATEHVRMIECGFI